MKLDYVGLILFFDKIEENHLLRHFVVICIDKLLINFRHRCFRFTQPRFDIQGFALSACFVKAEVNKDGRSVPTDQKQRFPTASRQIYSFLCHAKVVLSFGLPKVRA
jgi:hypothetical protein